MHARYVRSRSEAGERKRRTVLYCTVQNSKLAIICTPWRLFLITQESFSVIKSKGLVTKINKTD